MPEEKKGGDPEKVGAETKVAPAAVPAASPKNGKSGKENMPKVVDKKPTFSTQ